MNFTTSSVRDNIRIISVKNTNERLCKKTLTLKKNSQLYNLKIIQ